MAAREVERGEPAGSAKVERSSVPTAGAEVKRGKTSPTAVARRTRSPAWRMSPRRRASRAGRQMNLLSRQSSSCLSAYRREHVGGLKSQNMDGGWKIEKERPCVGVYLYMQDGRTVQIDVVIFLYGRSDGQSFVCFFACITSMDSCTLTGCD
jgi:hypothetical protein